MSSRRSILVCAGALGAGQLVRHRLAVVGDLDAAEDAPQVRIQRLNLVPVQIRAMQYGVAQIVELEDAVAREPVLGNVFRRKGGLIKPFQRPERAHDNGNAARAIVLCQPRRDAVGIDAQRPLAVDRLVPFLRRRAAPMERGDLKDREIARHARNVLVDGRDVERLHRIRQHRELKEDQNRQQQERNPGERISISACQSQPCVPANPGSRSPPESPARRRP